MVYMRKVPLHLDRNFKSRTSDVYTRQEQVGLGTYGEVFLAEEQNTKAKVALKRIKIDTVKEKRQGFPITAIREIRVLKALRHPNIVALIEVTRSKVGNSNQYKGSVYLVFEYVEHDLSGLHERLKKRDNKTMPSGLPPSLAKSLMKQMLEAIAFCHAHDVLHRDLKASNVLVSQDGQLKLADFGLARFLPKQEDLTYRVCTLWYRRLCRPPELLLGSSKYGAEVDVWSAGCIFFEMLTGSALFTGDKEISVLRNIMSLLGRPTWPQSEGIPAAESLKHYSKLPQDVEQMSLRDHVLRSMRPREPEPASLELLLCMLSLDPGQRPSAQECINHPYFASGVPEMTPPEFLELTRDMPMSHEYAVKQDRSRSRAGRGGGGAAPAAAAAAPVGSPHARGARPMAGYAPGLEYRHGAPAGPPGYPY